jgi:hypothetical protein
MIRMILARLVRQRDTYVRIIESIQKYTFVFTALAIWLTCVPANAVRRHFAPVRSVVARRARHFETKARGKTIASS